MSKNLVGWVYIVVILLTGMSIGSSLTFRYVRADMDETMTTWRALGHRWRHIGRLEGEAAALEQCNAGMAARRKLEQCAPQSHSGGGI